MLALADLVSPVAAFVRDCCKTGIGYDVPISDLMATWRSWCEDNGHKPGSVQTFGRDLRAVVPGLRVRQPRDGDTRERCYIGIALTAAHNGADRVPPRAGGQEHTDMSDSESVARDGTRTNPLLSQVQTSTECRVCGSPLLFATPGRDTCERCRLDDQGTSP